MISPGRNTSTLASDNNKNYEAEVRTVNAFQRERSSKWKDGDCVFSGATYQRILPRSAQQCHLINTCTDQPAVQHNSLNTRGLKEDLDVTITSWLKLPFRCTEAIF